ncbi:hydrogenase subunit MbhD domain-containing protein [Streptomyces sp. NPDC087218]|uniref:hydrogenase subunit MbhD domain-containing protein n=1 Tax=Streptomyces sp. NPDC087218 TaxID=3365769 RepID=UPI003813D1C8
MADGLILVALGLVVVAATAAALVSDPVRQALVLSLLGLCLAALFLVLQAPDVALSQLAVGSALTPLLLLLTVRTSRRRARRTGGDGAGSAGPDDGKPG